MAWCKVSSLTAAVSRTIRSVQYPASRQALLVAVEGKTVEGWELSYFLEKALSRRRYPDSKSVMYELELWLEKQG